MGASASSFLDGLFVENRVGIFIGPITTLMPLNFNLVAMNLFAELILKIIFNCCSGFSHF